MFRIFHFFANCKKRSWLVCKVEMLKMLMKLLKVDSGKRNGIKLSNIYSIKDLKIQIVVVSVWKSVTSKFAATNSCYFQQQGGTSNTHDCLLHLLRLLLCDLRAIILKGEHLSSHLTCLIMIQSRKYDWTLILFMHIFFSPD